MDLYLCNIFRGQLHPLQQTQTRKVQLKSWKRTSIYLKNASKNIKGSQIVRRMEKIQDDYTKHNHTKLDEINDDLHNSLLTAEKHLAPFPVYWWTKEIDEKYKIQQYWIAETTF